MDIKDVKLITETHIVDAEPVKVPPIFEITREDGTVEHLPVVSDNRHYWEVKEWYDAQESKPFDFEFEELPEPVFAETIYPETEEVELGDEVTEVAVPEVPQVPDEPETLMPRRG